MNAVALDLTPVVDTLLERPFDRPTLDKVYAAVEGHPHAYATALRCAAKRTEDSLAAGYWLTEAARIHESVDDLGGAIALLSRARDCDPGNPRTRELLAASMTRLAVHVGLDFTFTNVLPQVEAAPGVADDGRRVPRESGLRPPPLDRSRDTLPDLFGIDAEESRRTGELVERAVAVSAPPVAIVDPPAVDHEPVSSEEAPKTLDSAPVVFALQNVRRVETLLPPVDPEGVPPRAVPSKPEDEPVLRAIADIAMSTRRSSELARPPERLRARKRAVVAAPPESELAPPPERPRARKRAVVAAPPVEVYADPVTRRTERPAGDGLVAELFEALHGFHFLDEVRDGAAFLARVLEENMRPATVLVHVYDINSRHFVVVSATGGRAAALVDYATPEEEPFVVEIMKEDEATLVLQPGDDPRLSRGRWLLVEPQRSVLCAPATIEGRFLGLVELIDPLDGSEFDEDDRNALTYAASAFARFLDRRGIVLSEEDEQGSEGPSGVPTGRFEAAPVA
jgi:hypothetical protein